MKPRPFNILLIHDSAQTAQLFELALRESAPRATLYWVANADKAIEALARTNRFVDVRETKDKMGINWMRGAWSRTAALRNPNTSA